MPPRLVPVLRARVTGVRGSEVNLENYSDVRGRGSLAREYAITYRDHLESNERVIDGGTFWTGAAAAAARDAPSSRGLDRGEHPRALRHQRRRPDALRRRRPRRSRRASPASATSSGRTRAAAASCSCSGPGRSTEAPHTFIGLRQGAGGRDRAGALPARPGRAVSRTCRRSTSARSSRGSRPSSTTHARHLDRRRHRAPERRADPDRRGRDDQVPARLRGGHPAHARRQHADCWRRCWRSSTARSGLLAGAIGAAGALALSWAVAPLRLRHRLASRAGAARRRRGADDAAGRRHRRARQRRRPAQEAARDAPGGVTRASSAEVATRLLGLRYPRSLGSIDPRTSARKLLLR